MEKKGNVPQLRFPGFEGEWVEKTLGEIAEFSKGKGISKADISDDGKTLCIRYGELYTTYKEVIGTVVSRTNLDPKDLVFSKANDVIIPSSGETPIDIATASCVLQSGVALGGDLNIIRTPLNGVFLSYYLNNTRKSEIASLAQGATVVHLYSKKLIGLGLNVPTLPEQTKIADFLTAVDEKLQALQRKKALLTDYKKGMMQQLFSQTLRFKDDAGHDFPDWEEKRLGEVCEIRRGASPRPISDPRWFSDSSEIGWVRISDVSKSIKYLEKTEQYLSEAGISKSRMVAKGNIIMSICATIGKPIYTNFDVCIHDGFVVFEELILDKEYLFYYLDGIQEQWYRYGQPGTQINLNTGIVSSEIIPIPSLPEQTKIAAFLSALDEKIQATQQAIDQTSAWKKGLLQQLFV